jgi:hypothetical protein
MKPLASLLAILFLFAQASVPQTGQLPVPTGIPVPTGQRRAEQAESQSEQNGPLSPQPRKALDFAKLQQDADELASLAASIPPAVNQTNHGVMPKDMVEKLKRIEKLAKHLRGEINP